MLHCLADLFVTHGPPEHIRSDNGPEFIAINVREWLGRLGVKTLYIEPGSPWENGYCESLNSKLRDELLNGEIFTLFPDLVLSDLVLRAVSHRVHPGAREHAMNAVLRCRTKMHEKPALPDDDADRTSSGARYASGR